MAKRFELTNRSLEPGDEVQYSTSGSYRGSRGRIVMSKERILFVEEKGFIRLTPYLLLEIPYDEISEVKTHERNKLLSITRVDGVESRLTTRSPSKVESIIKNLMKQGEPEATTVT